MQIKQRAFHAFVHQGKVIKGRGFQGMSLAEEAEL
jgi:hypothetical protein